MLSHSPSAHAKDATPKYNVIFVTVDGVRYQEFLARKKGFLGRPEVGFPKFWNMMDQDSDHQFQVYDMKISNHYAISLPGYQCIFTGQDQGDRCKNNGGPQVNMETFPERLVREGFAKQDVVSIASWDGLARAVESKPGTIYSNFASQKFPDVEMNTVQSRQDADPAPWAPTRLDRYTGAHAIEYIKKYHPRFIHIGFDDSDEWGHRRNYDKYIDSLHQYDDYFQTLLSFLNETGEYGKNTALIITTDHGRGSGPFWNDHSKEFASAFKTWAILKLPANDKQKWQRSESESFEQIDLRPTIEKILGLSPLDQLKGHAIYRYAE